MSTVIETISPSRISPLSSEESVTALPNVPETKPLAAAGEEAQSTSSTSDAENLEDAPPWKPSWRLIIAVTALFTVTLIEALDATSLSVALPVRYPESVSFRSPTNTNLLL